MSEIFTSVWVLTSYGEKPLLFSSPRLAEKHLVNWDSKKELAINRYQYIVNNKVFVLALQKIIKV